MASLPRTSFGRLLHELDCRCRGCQGGAARTRRVILHDTLRALSDEATRNGMREKALENVRRWSKPRGDAMEAAELAQLDQLAGGGGAAAAGDGGGGGGSGLFGMCLPSKKAASLPKVI